MATPANMAVTPPQEVERIVGPILQAVQAVATFSSRPIVFSSFDPEICRYEMRRQETDVLSFSARTLALQFNAVSPSLLSTW